MASGTGPGLNLPKILQGVLLFCALSVSPAAHAQQVVWQGERTECTSGFLTEEQRPVTLTLQGWRILLTIQTPALVRLTGTLGADGVVSATGAAATNPDGVFQFDGILKDGTASGRWTIRGRTTACSSGAWYASSTGVRPRTTAITDARPDAADRDGFYVGESARGAASGCLKKRLELVLNGTAASLKILFVGGFTPAALARRCESRRHRRHGRESSGYRRRRKAAATRVHVQRKCEWQSHRRDLGETHGWVVQLWCELEREQAVWLGLPGALEGQLAIYSRHSRSMSAASWTRPKSHKRSGTPALSTT